MSTTYTYEDCASEPNICKIHCLVEASAMSDKAIEGCSYDSSTADLAVVFTNALSGDDEDILDGIVTSSLSATCDYCHCKKLENDASEEITHQVYGG